MTRLFRSKSCSLGEGAPRYSMPPLSSSPPSPDEDDEEVYFRDFNSEADGDSLNRAAIVSPGPNFRTNKSHHSHFSVLSVVAAALRRSLVTCSVEADDVASDVDICWPTDVQHVSHVTFDRFNGFLGLPVELQPVVPRKPPSASRSVFGVSAQSMQCCYDRRGNSVPTILVRMQNRLYSEGGLQAEGIFRINAENGQEEYVRNQLNKGVVPHGIDVHCLSGLIKAWFRELPSGVLDCLSPEQVMQYCNSEEECAQLVKLLPPTEAALLDWAVNLMADVVQHEHHNKMNARNIAMVFAPNMTQMADPLTALIHAVQVMNFLKTLILKTLREREESTSAPTTDTIIMLKGGECESTREDEESHEYLSNINNATDHEEEVVSIHDELEEEAAFDDCCRKRSTASCTDHNLSSSSATNTNTTSERVLQEDQRISNIMNNNNNEIKSSSSSSWSFRSSQKSSSDIVGEKYYECTLGRSTSTSFRDDDECECNEEGILNRLSLRKLGMWKLRRHPVFQLSRPFKKTTGPTPTMQVSQI